VGERERGGEKGGGGGVNSLGKEEKGINEFVGKKGKKERKNYDRPPGKNKEKCFLP